MVSITFPLSILRYNQIRIIYALNRGAKGRIII